MDIRRQEHCYFSTPEHIRGFVGTFIYLFTDRGALQLTDTHLRFTGKRGIPLEIALASIDGIAVGSYSRLAKPMRLDYLALTYGDRTHQRTFLLTPVNSWHSLGLESNKLVAEWEQILREAKARSVKMEG